MEDFSEKRSPLAPLVDKVNGWGAGPNPLLNTPDEAGRIAGFWHGVWHGAIAPITLIKALFSDDVHVFEPHNSGNGYIAGFLLGVLLWAGGGRSGGPRRRS